MSGLRRAVRPRLRQHLPATVRGLGLLAAAAAAFALGQRMAPGTPGSAWAVWQAWLAPGLVSLAVLLLAALLMRQHRARERSDAEGRRLTEELERLALVARNTFDAVVITDLARRITWVNAGFERITGWHFDEVLGRSPGELLQDARTDPATVARLRAALDAGEVFVGELLNRHRNGTLYWIELTIQPVRDPHGRVTGFMAVERDVTAARQAEAEVQRSAQLLRSAIDAIDEAFVLYDPDDRLVMCNDKYRQLYRASAAAIVPGARFEDILRHGLHNDQYLDAVGREDDWLAERLAQHRSGAATFVQRLGDGRTVRIEERHTPDGHRVGFRVDITELVRATEAAERAARAKTVFIATVSHELRTPLQSIIGFSELGQHFAADHAQFKAMFDDILSGGRRMLTLVNSLLDVSQIEAGISVLTTAPADLAALALAVVQDLQPQLAGRTGALKLPPLPVCVNAFRMQQVLRNLLANAIRFAPADSPIELAGGVDPDGGVWLSVRDHGPGIPEDELQSVFEPFVQSSRTRNGAGGTGLGLAVCRGIVQAHRGRITAANAEGGGALMTLWLPPAAPSPAPDPTARPSRDALPA